VKYYEIDVLVGKTLIKVEGLNNGSHVVTFLCGDGSTYRMEHMQDCCESVSLEEIVGDVADIIGTPILKAEGSANNDNPLSEYTESHTWTFYRLVTNKGTVVLRWYGESNGYYSEGVEFFEVEP